MGTQRTTITSVLSISSDQNEIPKYQDYPGPYFVFPDILSRNVTVEEYQKNQLKHKKTPRDIEFYDEHGFPVTYRNQHDDNPNETCNNFYPIHCQQGNENKVLPLHNDVENFTLNNLS